MRILCVWISCGVTGWTTISILSPSPLHQSERSAAHSTQGLLENKQQQPTHRGKNISLIDSLLYFHFPRANAPAWQFKGYSDYTVNSIATKCNKRSENKTEKDWRWGTLDIRASSNTRQSPDLVRVRSVSVTTQGPLTTLRHVRSFTPGAGQALLTSVAFFSHVYNVYYVPTNAHLRRVIKPYEWAGLCNVIITRDADARRRRSRPTQFLR